MPITENDTCHEWFLTYHSGWSVPRFCHRPKGHDGDCCGPGNGYEHLRGCTDGGVIRPGKDYHDKE